MTLATPRWRDDAVALPSPLTRTAMLSHRRRWLALYASSTALRQTREATHIHAASARGDAHRKSCNASSGDEKALVLAGLHERRTARAVSSLWNRHSQPPAQHLPPWEKLERRVQATVKRHHQASPA
mmetsp:Transcript_1370/g.3528  ORF Transcript_1370/g.3528 Transcript_1370/m.3528 type:complete len:127 (-) Transcript_1370:216-596(-)